MFVAWLGRCSASPTVESQRERHGYIERRERTAKRDKKLTLEHRHAFSALDSHTELRSDYS
jgi:hypothetical protein